MSNFIARAIRRWVHEAVADALQPVTDTDVGAALAEDADEPPAPEYLTAQQAADRLGVSTTWVYERCRGGEIPAEKVKGHGKPKWRIPAGELERISPLKLPDHAGAHMRRKADKGESAVSAREAASLLGVSYTAVKTHCRGGAVGAWKDSRGRWQVPTTALEQGPLTEIRTEKRGHRQKKTDR